MLEKEFKDWLSNKYNSEGTINARLANCLTVCEYEGDLDEHFPKDSCETIISNLTYSTDDERHKRKPRHNIPINGNIRNGTATLKQAVKLYIEFKKDMENGVIIPPQSSVNKKKRLNKKPSQSNWPTWELPIEDEIYQLAQIATKYIRFLNPKIIETITLDNIEHYNEWYDLLSINNINPNLYLWEMSPCCFPGVRRHAGRKEIAFFKKQPELNKNEIPNALKLDDNDFPKQIWSFTFRGKQFGKFGPAAYSLAHLFDHKASKNRMEDELEFINENKFSEPYYGLYTCPSNTVYVPNSLLRPTDFNLTLRRLLFLKAESLYKDYCNILPPFIKIPNFEDEKWNIENFKWGECVGNTDNVSIFLCYRNNFMMNIKQNP
jgi:hypothetical protein